jgi:hypothetical protein
VSGTDSNRAATTTAATRWPRFESVPDTDFAEDRCQAPHRPRSTPSRWPRARGGHRICCERLGYPAFIAMIAIYALMANKPALWA